MRKTIGNFEPYSVEDVGSPAIFRLGHILDVQKTLFKLAVVFVLECRPLCGLDTLSIYPLSAVLERWLPFRQEGGHPFLLVIKSKRGMKGAALEEQALSQRCLVCPIDRFLDHHDYR